MDCIFCSIVAGRLPASLAYEDERVVAFLDRRPATRGHLLSALKHGVEAADINHAWTHALRLVEYDYNGDERLLVIGPDRHGRLLEIVAVPVGRPTRIIHADRLRPKFYDYPR